MNIELTSPGRGATIGIHPAPGGRLASIVVEGLELVVTSGDRTADWGCYVMAPFAGRIRDGRFTYKGTEHQLPRNMGQHAIHGTVFERPWKVEGTEPDRAVLSC